MYLLALARQARLAEYDPATWLAIDARHLACVMSRMRCSG
jgi:hypothetical protein